MSVVVPVFNSEGTLEPLVERLERVLEGVGGPFELLLIDDGSRDGSWGVVERLAASRGWVRGVRLMRNFGQHNALLCGVREARWGVVVTLDDDLQHPPEAIPALLEALEERELDVVYGVAAALPHGVWRNLASRVTKLALQAAMGAETARLVSAFRAFRVEVREAFAAYRSPFVSLDVLLTWGTTRFGAVRVEHAERAVGRSNYTLRKLVLHALNMATGFSALPLRAAVWVGFGFTLFGVVILGVVLVRWWEEGSVVPGFPFLASTLAIFSGAQLFALGVIGEYLGRVYFRTMDKPTYVVRPQLDLDQETSPGGIPDAGASRLSGADGDA